MSIVPLVRVTLCGLLEEKDATLRELQALGVAHLLAAGDAEETGATAPATASSAREALHYLLGAANRWHQVHDPQGFDARSVEERALSTKRQTRALEDERLRLERRRSERRRLPVWVRGTGMPAGSSGAITTT